MCVALESKMMECTIAKALSGSRKMQSEASDSLPIQTVIFSVWNEEWMQRWNEFVPSSDSFLSMDYLAALSQMPNKDLEMRWVIFQQGDRWVGVAAFQITHFASSPEAFSNRLMRWIHGALQWLRLGHVHNLLICGNSIATGQHGFVFLDEISKSEQARLLNLAMNQLAEKESNQNKRLCATVVKDFYPQTQVLANAFTQYGYKTFCTDYNMVMPILSQWKSMDDYLQSMNTKFRTKAKSALNKSSVLDVEVLTKDTITAYLPFIQKLYENVHYKAEFRLGKMDVNVLVLLLERMPDRFFVEVYKKGEEVVGFKSAMRCGESLEAHIIGLNYEFNKSHAIYQRMLYDYVAQGIAKQCTRVVLGRTAAEIKSSIGALPVELTCALIHQQKISNAFLKTILRYVKPTPFDQRNPYKAETWQKIQTSGILSTYFNSDLMKESVNHSHVG